MFQTLQVSESDFKNIMGKINTVSDYSDKLLRVFPILLVVLLGLKYFDVYNKVMNMAGLNDFIRDETEKEDNISFVGIENELESFKNDSLI